MKKKEEGNLTLAIPKGRLFADSLNLLKNIGIYLQMTNQTRALISKPNEFISIIYLKTWDIPTYVSYGIADLGIVGSDVVYETQVEVYEPLDFNFGKCRLVMATSYKKYKEGLDKENLSNLSPIKIATKYPNITKDYFSAKTMNNNIHIIRLYGSVEAAIALNLADAIIEIVETGKTLKDNQLIEIDQIMNISARLIVNKVSFKLKSSTINSLIEQMKIDK